MNNFWKKLNKPFFALAPMADVTDAAFRRLVAKYGKPDVLWTEFVSADGLCHPKGRESLLKDLEYSEAERPIVAQLFSSNPENMRAAAKLCAELGFDGVDINMGCPDRTIEKQGCGAAMMKDPENAVAIIRAARAGILESGKEIPLSVKTRVGYNKNEIETWIPTLLREGLDALTVHARTRKDLSNVPANWDYIKRVVELRNELSPDTVILGNGDVTDLDDGKNKATQTGCDGIMVGRAIFGNPWLFAETPSTGGGDTHRVTGGVSFMNQVKKFLVSLTHPLTPSCRGGTGHDDYITSKRYWLHNQSNIPLAEKLGVMVEHAKLFDELLGTTKNFAVMKKHFKAYATGFPGARELRIKLMESQNVGEAERIVDEFLNA